MREGDHAEELFAWALDYGKLKQSDPNADLPPELKAADPRTYHFLQAAQLDGQVRFLKKTDGATDGWSQAVISPGWSIQHSFGHPWDFEVGKSYRMFKRGEWRKGPSVVPKPISPGTGPVGISVDCQKQGGEGPFEQTVNPR